VVEQHPLGLFLADEADTLLVDGLEKGDLYRLVELAPRVLNQGVRSTRGKKRGDQVPFSMISPTKTLAKPATICAIGWETC
jgi:hypothetical protein